MLRPGEGVRGLERAPGHWLRAGVIAWPGWDLPAGVDPAGLDWRLHWSADDSIDPEASDPLPWDNVLLRFDPAGLPAAIAAAYPHLRGRLCLRVPAAAIAQVPQAVRCEVAVSVHLPSGRLVDAGSLQLGGVIDDLLAAPDAELGPSWQLGTPTLRLWAPTARSVALLLWPEGADLHETPQRRRMLPAVDGTWAITGEPGWQGARYRFEVTVYTPHHRRVVTNAVTDPYSTSLTVNSTHSVLVDLDDPRWAPQQWRQAASPALEDPVDQVIYELHLRDFSVSDASVPAGLRGSFLAPTVDSVGMAHLSRLAEAGLTTVQLLPLFDNASVEEHPERQLRPVWDLLRGLPPDSPEQQRHVTRAGGRSAFNWGYDPWHYFAPEGSFSSTLASAEGGGRVSECRAMVGAFHAAGLRVVLDQVFNHTASAGQDTKSVLDRIVPGYYHRRDADGAVEQSTCCPNVATEHVMAQKLMVDACVHWARGYRVDGFRFDLMGHHSRANMLAVRAALDALTLEADGVDGRGITMHGEGWDFGEVAGNAQFVQATQGQLGGTGIATFSDRLRDAVRGGGVWDGDPRGQGLGTGLFTADNGWGVNGDHATQGERLAWCTDLVQLGLAGTLRGYRFGSNSRHAILRGDELEFGGGPAGYADEPGEVISYVDAHDNETLFDAITLKVHPATPMEARVRLNTVCLAFATLGQSPVMWHAGADILRSKSLDRNSYNSGDWFNHLDFTMTDNGFGAGLPPEPDNAHTWHVLAPLLADPRLKPHPEDIRRAHEQALDLLRLRASTRLFRLARADLVSTMVRFPVADSWHQLPGVVVMAIDDPSAAVEERWSSVLAVFNTTPWLVRQTLPLDGRGYRLHPVQEAGADPEVRSCEIGADWLTVPGRTVAVFVRPR
ncbi:pullulanase-type alpha-1,6-glucosidase [Propionicimonas sp.]|uniref:pullulanase-type alpha-1,6-glucosidase n=1 Tax=Propionicimonas sp. TaxID=1955623 RepID=UPI0039E545D7